VKFTTFEEKEVSVEVMRSTIPGAVEILLNEYHIARFQDGKLIINSWDKWPDSDHDLQDEGIEMIETFPGILHLKVEFHDPRKDKD
jgi:hypothetical protein